MNKQKIIKTAVGVKLVLPAVSAILALVFAFLPTVQFIVDGKAKERVSSVELLSDMERAIEKNEGVQLDGVSRLFLEDVKVSAAVFYIFAVLSVALSFYLAITSLRALSLPPRSNGANRAKVWLGFVFPKFFLVPACALLPLGVTMFPHFIYSHYLTWYGYATDFALGDGVYIPTLIVVTLFYVDAVLSVITRRFECEFELDMWQKYTK